MVLEFYCGPARAWHSHASECGRTGKGRRGRKRGSERRAKQQKMRRREGMEERKQGRREMRESNVVQCVIVQEGMDLKEGRREGACFETRGG